MIDLVVDSNSLFARSWFASQKMDQFEPVLSLTLACRTILTIMHPDFNRLGITFDRMLFAWDGDHAHNKQREPKPPEYHESKRGLRNALTVLFGAAHFDHPDHEGDDVVATAVYQNKPENEIVVVSGDKDLQQLHGRNCRYYCLNTKAMLSRQFICQKWHVKRPNQLAIALAIQGDSVDGIKGIPGYGEVKSRKLFEQVPKTAKFNEALRIIESQIPEDKLPPFYDSLNRTLLSANVTGVPEPADIVMANPVDVARLKIPDLMARYDSVYRCYTA